MKKRFWTSWRSTKSTDIWRSGGGFGRRICKVGKGAQVENLLFYWFFCASVDVGRFLYLNKYASGLGSTNLSRILRFNFSYETDFWANSFVAKKSARYQTFLAVVWCLFHNHLRLKRSCLLNVYLNSKFEFSLISSYLNWTIVDIRIKFVKTMIEDFFTFHLWWRDLFAPRDECYRLV